MSAARPSRIAADLFESATRVGKLESRSATQQLDHWARVGRSVSMHHTAARQRVEAALAGTVSLADLSPEERIVVNAELDVAIAEHAHATSYGAELAAEGITTVVLADDGALVAHHADGTTSPVEG
jgi:hypothetical protein